MRVSQWKSYCELLSYILPVVQNVIQSHWGHLFFLWNHPRSKDLLALILKTTSKMNATLLIITFHITNWKSLLCLWLWKTCTLWLYFFQVPATLFSTSSYLYNAFDMKWSTVSSPDFSTCCLFALTMTYPNFAVWRWAVLSSSEWGRRLGSLLLKTLYVSESRWKPTYVYIWQATFWSFILYISFTHILEAFFSRPHSSIFPSIVWRF